MIRMYPQSTGAIVERVTHVAAVHSHQIVTMIGAHELHRILEHAHAEFALPFSVWPHHGTVGFYGAFTVRPQVVCPHRLYVVPGDCAINHTDIYGLREFFSGFLAVRG
jgi:hypothetical protein